MTTTLDKPTTAPTETPDDAQARAVRMQRQLEQVYGADRVYAWLEEGRPLPAASAELPNTIAFEAQVFDIATKRGKEGARTKVVLVANRRGTPIDDLCDLSEQATMLVRLTPRIQQQSFLQGMVDTSVPLDVPDVDADEDVPLEPDISDETLRLRFLALAGDGREPPAGWEQWSQERKAQVGQWCWGMILNASDHQVKMPPTPEGMETWYWGDKAAAPDVPTAETANGDAGWADNPPPSLSPEAIEQVAKHSSTNGKSQRTGKKAAAASTAGDGE